MKNGKWKYKVGGRARGIIPSLFLVILFGGVSIYLYLDKQGIFLFSLLLTAIALVLVFVCIFQAKFVKVLIGERGIFLSDETGKRKIRSISGNQRGLGKLRRKSERDGTAFR